MFLLMVLINQSFIDIKFEFNLLKFPHFNSWLHKFGCWKKFYNCIPYYLFGYVFRKYNPSNPFRNNNAIGGIFRISRKVEFLYSSFLGFIWNDLRIFALVLFRKISKWKTTFKISRYKRKIFRNFFEWFNQK